jgi:hypothetical protein
MEIYAVLPEAIMQFLKLILGVVLLNKGVNNKDFDNRGSNPLVATMIAS